MENKKRLGFTSFIPEAFLGEDGKVWNKVQGGNWLLKDNWIRGVIKIEPLADSTIKVWWLNEGEPDWEPFTIYRGILE